jgi:hypothetical protein
MSGVRRCPRSSSRTPSWHEGGRAAQSVVPVLLLLSTAASAEPVTDGFEAESLGPLWNLRLATPGRVTVQRDIVYSGTRALRVEIHERDIPMVGADGMESERTEVQEGDALHPRFGETHARDVDFRFGLYRDRMATPMVIYFDDFRKERLAQ